MCVAYPSPRRSQPRCQGSSHLLCLLVWLHGHHDTKDFRVPRTLAVYWVSRTHTVCRVPRTHTVCGVPRTHTVCGVPRTHTVCGVPGKLMFNIQRLRLTSWHIAPKRRFILYAYSTYTLFIYYYRQSCRLVCQASMINSDKPLMYIIKNQSCTCLAILFHTWTGLLLDEPALAHVVPIVLLYSTHCQWRETLFPVHQSPDSCPLVGHRLVRLDV